VATGTKFLKFRCTRCGNCCKEPLLPLTDADVRRIAGRTGDDPTDFVVWIDRFGIDMDDEPEAFVMLRQGRRVMVLRHDRRGCRYLGEQGCTIYSSRPTGCRVFPFDPSFDKQGKLRRLRLIDATDCRYELDGRNDVDTIQSLHERHQGATFAYHQKVATWNALQKRRRRAGKAAQSAREFFAYLGFDSRRASAELGAAAP
jgi:Fe-S-cluster containining protein